MSNFSLTSQDIQSRLPDLYWATVFGSPYVAMFGEERLLSAPVARTELLDNGSVLLQLTKSLTDVKDDVVLEGARAKAKDYLGLEAFFSPERSQAGLYRAPQFTFLTGS